MSWQFDDKPLLTHLFGSFLALSIDLQKIILDYLFRREVIPFDKNGVPSYLRCGLVLMSGEVAYEIRAYNENESHVFSTCDVIIAERYNSLISIYRDKIIKEKHWHDVFLENDHWPHFRYAFSPVTKQTYYIKNTYYYPNTISISIFRVGGSFKFCDSCIDVGSGEAKAKIIEFCRHIEKCGKDMNDQNRDKLKELIIL